MSSSRTLVENILMAPQEINRAEIEASIVIFVDRCRSSVPLEETRMLSSMQFIKRFGGSERGNKLTLEWIPSHVDIYGSEIADNCPKLEDRKFRCR